MNGTYISLSNHLNKTSYSGIAYYLSKQLCENGIKLTYIDELNNLIPARQKIKRKAYSYINKQFQENRTRQVSELWSSFIKANLPQKSDFLFSYSSLPFSNLEIDLPKFFWTDAVFSNLLNYYPGYSNQPESSISNGNNMELKSLNNVSLAIFTSNWAANEAIMQYNISPQKIKVIPFGANIEKHLPYKELQNKLESIQGQKQINFLFLGADWERKGGQKSIAIVKELINQGIKCQLFIIGGDPGEDILNLNFVTYYSFINKSSKKDEKLMFDILGQTHFYLLPTKADCTPIAINECNAFGIPAITTNEGGIPEIVKEGINGYLFDKNDSTEKYSDCILSLFTNKQRYIELSKSSYNEYLQRLNWNTSIKIFKELVYDFI